MWNWIKQTLGRLIGQSADFDLKGEDKPLPPWDPNQTSESLNNLFQRYVVEVLTESINWYFSKRNSKRVRGFVVRICAVIAAGFGVLIPILAELWETKANQPYISPGWAAVALLVGAGLVWVDRFLDGTSGWLRYVTTGLALAQLRDESVLRWKSLEATWNDSPDATSIQSAFDLLTEINKRAHELVKSETAEWKANFLTSLSQVDSIVKSKLEQSEQALADESAKGKGAIEVKITGPAKVTNSTLSVERDGHNEEPRHRRDGSQAVFTDLQAGVWRAIAEGQVDDSGKDVPFRREVPALVKTDGVVTVELEL